MTKEIKQKIVALQDQLKAGHSVASLEFRKILERSAVKKAVDDITALRDNMVNESPEEKQLDALLSVHRSILQYLSQNYAEPPVQTVQPETPAEPAA